MEGVKRVEGMHKRRRCGRSAQNVFFMHVAGLEVMYVRTDGRGTSPMSESHSPTAPYR